MSAIAPKTGIDSLFREPSMRGRVRRAAHDCITGDGPVVLIYGCSECNWIYRALNPGRGIPTIFHRSIHF